MKVLALELSTARGSLAWLNEHESPIVREWPNDRKHSGKFFENLHDLTGAVGPAEKIIVGLGPGSYAGTRIAVAAAVGLQAAWNVQLIGYASICAVTSGDYCIIGDARRQSFFFARIHQNELEEGPDLFDEAGLKQKLDKVRKDMPIFASEDLPQFEGVATRYPSALILANVANDSNRIFTRPPLEPIYLREPHITKPRHDAAVFADRKRT